MLTVLSTGTTRAVAKVDTARRESEGEGMRGTRTGDNNEKTAATRATWTAVPQHRNGKEKQTNF